MIGLGRIHRGQMPVAFVLIDRNVRVLRVSGTFRGAN